MSDKGTAGVEAAQRAWVERVLGVRIEPDPLSGPEIGQQVRALWLHATETVDGQIAALQSALRASGEDTLEEIAEFGLNGLTGNHRVRVLAALKGLGGARHQVAAAALVAVAQEFEGFVQGSEKLAACDDNPFDVPMSIRATLGGALREMQTMLNRAGVS